MNHFFKPKVAIAEFFWKMQEKSGINYEKWVGRHASFPPKRSVKLQFYLANFDENMNAN